ncbi:MAG: NAD-dependent succinate-semialdehyde dehydrogenase [Planctomycetaceae bacterium]|nr:NAD-dependent succinate-semialdehyde dehydrogenase [Planctomycetaceae bacterium]
MQTINPATEQLVCEYKEHTSAQIDLLLENALNAFNLWKTVSFAERSQRMRQASGLLRDRAESFAVLMTTEMGKPVREARAEVEKCAWVCEFYADHAEGFLAPQPVVTDAASSYVRHDPLGPLLAIMPWNFPFWQVFRFAAPALMAGNTALLKHSSNVTGCSVAIEQLFRDAGFPVGCFTSLVIPSSKVADVIADRAVQAVSVTGSENAGRKVAEVAGRNLKKCVLELGGSDAFVVRVDADLLQAASCAARSRTMNSGQSCIAAKRFLVHDQIADEFVDRLAEEMQALVVGDPSLESTSVGPLARKDLLDELSDQVTQTVEQGARTVTGGHRLQRSGFFYAPTILADVTESMTAFQEELFGPVAAVIRFTDDDDAVRLANLSRFGLGASIWTSDVRVGQEMAARLEAGAVFINGIVRSDPRMPFGGIKASGYGRELGKAGIMEFVNQKTVWIEK